MYVTCRMVYENIVARDVLRDLSHAVLPFGIRLFGDHYLLTRNACQKACTASHLYSAYDIDIWDMLVTALEVTFRSRLKIVKRNVSCHTLSRTLPECIEAT